MYGNLLCTPLHSSLLWGAMVLVLLAAGNAQRRRLGVGLRRLVAVAAGLALLVLAPVVTATVLGEKLDLSWGQPVVRVAEDGGPSTTEPRTSHAPRTDSPGHVPPITKSSATEATPELRSHRGDEMFFGIGYVGLPAPVNLLVLLLVLATLARYAFALMRPLDRLVADRGDLPEVRDAAVRERVAAIAERMGLACPRVLRLGSRQGSLELQACTGGLLAPVVIASDGVLDRLRQDQTAAVLAHELGHVARHSVLRNTLLLVGLAVLCTAASAWLVPTVTLALWFAAAHTVMRLHGHLDELGADLHAARTVGFGAMARALHTVHGPRTPTGSPWLRRLVYATATHPAAAVRLAHLARHAPATQRPEVPVDAREAQLQARTSGVILALATAAFGAAVWAGLHEDWKWYGVAVLAAVAAVPVLLVVAAYATRILHAWRVGYLSWVWQVAWGLGRMLGCAALVFGGLLSSLTWLFYAGLLLAVVFVWHARKRRRTLARMGHAMRQQNFAVALAEFARLPARLRRRPELRTTRVSLLAAVGETDAALAEVEALAHQRPRYWPGRLLHSVLLRPRQGEAALAIADEVVAALPNNLYALLPRAGCLRWLGRHDEAAVCLQRVLSLDPSSGMAYAVLAWLAARQGDLDAAATQLAEAERRDAGSTWLPLVRAELALARGGDPATASAAVEAAVAAVAAHRLSFLGPEVEDLQRRHAAGAGGAPRAVQASG